MEGYVIIKKVIREDDLDVVYVSLGRTAEEKPDMNNKEQRALSLAWKADHKRIKYYLQTSYSVDSLIAHLILEFRLAYGDVIRNINKTATKQQVKEMLSYIDGFITVCVENNQ